MAEKWKKTYRTAGNFTFTAESAGIYKFHVIGKGGNGSPGRHVAIAGGDGGNGGAGGGYAIHQTTLAQGETVQITVNTTLSQIICQGNTVIANAGGTYGGTATGGNLSNIQGKSGSPGASGSSGGSNGIQSNGYGGRGGSGAASVGKYQASGASGGSGGSGRGSNGSAGKSTANTDTSIGGAGGGGGGPGGTWNGSDGTGGAGGAGQIGGVVVEAVTAAPTAPAWIEVDGNKVVFGVDVHVGWGSATDLDNDLSGYVLERAVNESAWAQVYQGSLRNYTDVPGSDWTTVQYRIKAYDSEEQSSGYISTTKLTVIANSPPSSPGAISFPAEIRGNSTIIISWGRATDADNNLAGYHLEQCVDGGSWEEVKVTTALTADIPITYGWQTIQFRVRAYDAYGALGEYVTSEVATIINNRPPVISGEDLDLGTMVSSFAPQTYTVTDEDGDAVRVVENLDGTEKKAFDAVLGDENTLAILPEAWRKILNGKHTFRIMATDAQGAAVTRQMTFTKQEGQICFTLTQPLVADAMPERCILSIQGAFPAGSVLMIEVCNNAFDEAPMWDDITNKVLTGQKHYFANTEKTAEQWGLGVRVSLNRGTAVGDCYIHSIRGNYA